MMFLDATRFAAQASVAVYLGLGVVGTFYTAPGGEPDVTFGPASRVHVAEWRPMHTAERNKRHEADWRPPARGPIGG